MARKWPNKQKTASHPGPVPTADADQTLVERSISAQEAPNVTVSNVSVQVRPDLDWTVTSSTWSTVEQKAPSDIQPKEKTSEPPKGTKLSPRKKKALRKRSLAGDIPPVSEKDTDPTASSSANDIPPVQENATTETRANASNGLASTVQASQPERHDKLGWDDAPLEWGNWAASTATKTNSLADKSVIPPMPVPDLEAVTAWDASIPSDWNDSGKALDTKTIPLPNTSNKTTSVAEGAGEGSEHVAQVELGWGESPPDWANWDEDEWGAAGTVPAYDFDSELLSEAWDSPRSSDGWGSASSPTLDAPVRSYTPPPDPEKGSVKESVKGLPIPTVSHNDFEKLKEVLQSGSRHVGLGIHCSIDCKVINFVFSTSNTILILERDKIPEAGDTHLTKLLTSETPSVVGLDLGRIALTVRRETKMHVRGIDLGSSYTGSTRLQFPPLHMAEVANKNHDVLMELAAGLESTDASSVDDGLRQAVMSSFFSHLFASSDILKTQSILILDTRRVLEEDLALMMTIQLQWDFLQRTKPTHYENDFEHVDIQGAEVHIRNARYATKVREGSEVILKFDTNEIASGRAVRVRGRETIVRLTDGAIAGSSKRTVESIQVITRERLSNSEIARREWVLQMLSKPTSLRDRNEVLRTIWLPTDLDKVHLQVETKASKEEAQDREEFYEMLDESQAVVACAMLNRNLNIVVTHGPPGSGKTYTIRAALNEWASQGQSTWVIAQSNVGVKNIAESLTRHGFHKYKLLVSSEFYEDWHESIYAEVRNNLIRSDQLPDKPEVLKFVLASYPVILCTLSMLSNPLLNLRGVFECNPVSNLVVDEASQVYVGDYIHILHRFPVKKACFFGDPNQLPPFGAESTTGLGTVFDIPHLNDNSLHLSTTYRMPSAIGTFLSDEVYNYSLSCRHKSRSTYTLAFVNARKGTETKVGMSWKNSEEVYLIVRLVELYYQWTDFVVITPYDAQRAAIDRELKAVNPNWKGKVYNVDSFQGSEADYVLVSLTRTSRPGFLKDERRVNVMLSRCKKGMVIVSKKTFLHRSDIRDTLIGRLAERWKAEHPTDPWVDFFSILEGTADLPGAPKKREASRAYDAEWANEVYTQQTRSKTSKTRVKNAWIS